MRPVDIKLTDLKNVMVHSNLTKGHMAAAPVSRDQYQEMMDKRALAALSSGWNFH